MSLLRYAFPRKVQLAVGAGLALALVRQLSKRREKRRTNTRLAQMQHSIEALETRTHGLVLRGPRS